MAVKVFNGPDGWYAVADTPREALELIKLGSNGFSHASSAVEDSHAFSDKAEAIVKTEEQRCSEFFSGINERAQRLLAALRNHKEGIDGEKLSEEVHEPSTAFGGILGGVSKIAEKNGLNIDKLVFSEMRLEGSKRFRFFRPESMLLKYGHLLKPRFPREKAVSEEGR
ncbi:MAG: hypothetical protein ACLQPD_03370 [Desulfomonilaceae bacterium]